MIQVNKNFNEIPLSLKDKSIEEKLEKILKDPGLAKNEYRFKEDVRKKLGDIYNNKCAYCEFQVALEVDHYRPKAGVAKVKNHNGYYWLKFEWSNLLYSCHDCNKSKKNRFPLAGKGIRIFSPQSDRGQWLVNSGSFSDERPLLLNPEIDKPEDHLVFLYDGSIEAANGSIRGKKTIEICNLNRQTLKQGRRKKLIDDLFRDIRKQCFLSIDEKSGKINKNHCQLAFRTIFEKIKNNQAPVYEFSRVYFFMHKNFDIFIDNNTGMKDLPDPLKSAIKEAYLLFREGKL